VDALADGLIAQPGPARPVLLGYSGGLDSTVLLALLAATPALHGGLRAIHVDHGLHPDSTAWADHCRRCCAALGVPLEVERVQVPRAGGSPEGDARSARHAAFARALRKGEVLALAHHADDQAETFLLRALRASGPDGLAAMQSWRAHGAGWLWRPLLRQPRAALLAHAQRHGLHWIEDPSNADTTLDRNFLRRDVLPLLQRRWPHAADALARSAGLCAEASLLLQQDDALALEALRGRDPHVLDVAGLVPLPRERRARVLRAWIASLGLPPLPGNGVARIESELLPAAGDAEAAFAWAGARLRRWRQCLHAGVDVAPLPGDWHCEWDGAQALPIPGGGMLRLEGASVFDAPLRARARRGGERILLPGRAHRHALKHVLQAQGVPPWERERMPLLFGTGEELLAAGDRVLAAPLAAWLQARRARLAWTP